MALIRLIHRKHFDPTRERFLSLAFKTSSDGSGASVIDTTCVGGKRQPLICCHIREFYPDIAGDPPIYWEFEEGTLPDGYSIVVTRSASGDDCHRDIQDVSDHRLAKYFKTAALEDLMICDGDDPAEGRRNH